MLALHQNTILGGYLIVFVLKSNREFQVVLLQLLLVLFNTVLIFTVTVSGTLSAS